MVQDSGQCVSDHSDSVPTLTETESAEKTSFDNGSKKNITL